MAALGTRLRRAFTRTVAALEEAGLQYAVVDGVAVGIHSEPRVTRELDFAIAVASDADAERVVLGLQRSGFIVDAVFENDAGRLSTVRTLHRSTVGKERPVHAAITYLENQGDRMGYVQARALGLPIGSGNVEATCKSLVGQRMVRTARDGRKAAVSTSSISALALGDRFDAAIDLTLEPLVRQVRTAA